MASRALVALGGVVAACGGGGGHAPDAGPRDAPPGWVAEPTPAPSSVFGENLTGIAGASTDDVWVVGQDGTILHRAASGWSLVDSGTTASLDGVWASSAGEAWAVGAAGTILHRAAAGQTWSAQASGVSADLHGVWGASATDLWVVGDGGTILHGDGTTWTPSTSGTTRYLRSVWGASATDVWAVGEAGTLLHWLGAQWDAVGGTTTAALVGIHGTSASDVWAVANTQQALHWEGAGWSAVDIGAGVASPACVFAESASDAWIGSSKFAVEEASLSRWDGGAWQVQPDDLGSVLAIGRAGALWATGAAQSGSFAIWRHP